MINPYNREKGVGRMAKTIVGAVLENDPASRNWFNVILNYPGVHAIFFIASIISYGQNVI